ncbi:hypothetical protein GLOIN_2v1482214 [Rhizophagus clarus]|uniref:Uncharacterized protein n=1 Tax=Rhizophagus clarus TaxID=94130 RepID=A0A8H3LXN0_9GLOM|nr:hypothetical protein GLOIN_2v1482214 [Rhizophagus clarus]
MSSTNVRQEFNHLFLMKSGITEDEFGDLLAYITNNPNKISDIEENLKYGSDKVKVKYLRKLLDSEQPIGELPIKKRHLEQGWKSYTTSDGHSVELPPQIIDMLESDKFAPNLCATFRAAFQNFYVGQSIDLPHLGQKPKHFAEGYQGKKLLVTEQMIGIWNELSKDSDHSIKRVLSSPMGVGKSYISYFLVSKAYAKGWLILYIANTSDLNVESSRKAGEVICRFFLALNKDILTATYLKQIIRHVDYDSKKVEIIIAKDILDLIKLADRKTLLIVDEHGILFEKDPVPLRIHLLSPLMNLNFWGESYKFARVILTGTAHARYEREYIKNGQYEFWVIYVGLLQSSIFDILLQLHPVLKIQGIKEEAKKVTNYVPRELIYLVKYINKLNIIIADVDCFQQVLKKFEIERVNKILVIAQKYYNDLPKNEKTRYYDALTSIFLTSKPFSQFEWKFLDLGLIYRCNTTIQLNATDLNNNNRNVITLHFNDYDLIKNSQLSLEPGNDKVLGRSFDSKSLTKIRQAFEPMSAQADISSAQINRRNQIEMYLDEMYGSRHSARISALNNKFVVTKNGVHMPGFYIVYIRGSLGTPNHSGKVCDFPDVAHITFEEIKRQFFPNIV